MNFIKKAVATATAFVISASVLSTPALAAKNTPQAVAPEGDIQGNLRVTGNVGAGNNFRAYEYDSYARDNPYGGNENAVFTWNNVTAEDIRKKSDIETDELNEYMERYPHLAGIGNALLKAQNDYGVNLIFLLAVIRLESGNGKSWLAQTKNNLGGLTSKNGYQHFADKNECVDYMARLISERYLDRNGSYFNGYSITGIARRYSGSPDQWVSLVSALIIEIQRQFDS